MPDELGDRPGGRGGVAGAPGGQTGSSRRWALRIGAAGAAAVAVGAARSIAGPSLSNRGLMSANGVFDAASIAVADNIFTEVFPTSPLILNPFTDELPIPKALVPLTPAEVAALPNPPGPGVGQQNSLGNETHQIWPSDIGFPDPIVYQIKVELNTHSFTSSQVMPINSAGQPTQSFDSTGKVFAAGTVRS